MYNLLYVTLRCVILRYVCTCVRTYRILNKFISASDIDIHVDVHVDRDTDVNSIL